MKKFLLPLAMAFVLTGCATYQYTARTVGVGTEPIGAKKAVAEVVPDYDRVVTSSSRYERSVTAAIEAAEYRCLVDNNIDVVVDPIIKIERVPSLSMKKYKATITGFAGQYRRAPAGLDAVVDYEVEDIEKYMLMTDPEFVKQYYSKDKGAKGSGDVYYINTSGESTEQKMSSSDSSISSQPLLSVLKVKKKADGNKSGKKKDKVRKSGKLSGLFTGASNDGIRF